jgi:septum site-determining protein MinC
MQKGACELKSAQFALMRLAIYQTDAHSVQSFVADQVSAAPSLLEGAPLAIDFTAIEAALDPDFAEDVISRLRYAGMLPIALVGEAESKIADLAAALKLGLLAPQKRDAKKVESPTAQAQTEAPKADVPKVETPKVETPKVELKPEQKLDFKAEPKLEPSQAPRPAKAVDSMPSSTQRYEGQVRSGQQLYARGRDLLVLGPVSHGAEVISDGSVHIYGRLSGKVIAGASGDESARIYCLAFGAELVSIAGVFRVFESIPASLAGRAVQIWREGDKLRLEALI